MRCFAIFFLYISVFFELNNLFNFVMNFCFLKNNNLFLLRNLKKYIDCFLKKKVFVLTFKCLTL